MTDSDPDYVLSPRSSKKFTCSQGKLPPTLLVSARKNIGVENDERTSAQRIDENETPVNKIMTRSSSKNVYASIKSYDYSIGNSMPHLVDNSFVQKVNGSSNKKRMCRCNKCENCLQVNCKSCRACKDMKKYGGPGTLKLSCLMRPNCLNVFVPTLQKRNIMAGTFLKKSIRKDRRPKKMVRINDRYKNTTKAHEINGNEGIIGDEEIPPYKPRIFPMNDKDFEVMMSEQGTGGKDQNFNLKKNIPTPNWVITEREQKKVHRDTDDIDDRKLRDASVKGYGDFKDFEDISDKVYKLRHARAAAMDGGIEDDSEEVRYGGNNNLILELRDTSIGL